MHDLCGRGVVHRFSAERREKQDKQQQARAHKGHRVPQPAPAVVPQQAEHIAQGQHQEHGRREIMVLKGKPPDKDPGKELGQIGDQDKGRLAVPKRLSKPPQHRAGLTNAQMLDRVPSSK